MPILLGVALSIVVVFDRAFGWRSGTTTLRAKLVAARSAIVAANYEPFELVGLLVLTHEFARPRFSPTERNLHCSMSRRFS